MLVDEEGFLQLVQSVREGFKLDSKNYLFRDNKKGYPFRATATATAMPQDPSAVSDALGINVGICSEDKNYELGWMAFEKGVLIGFVYDGAYCDLVGRYFQCGNNEVEIPRPSESESGPESEDETFEFDESEEQTPHRSLRGSSVQVCSSCGSLEILRRSCYKCHDAGQIASRPSNRNLQPQPSRAIKIVNPATGEEVVGPYDRRLTQVQDNGGQIARDNGSHAHIAQECLNPKKRKHGGSQFEQGEVRNCDFCHRDGHTRENCFILHPELRKVFKCDYCHKDGHTMDRCFALHPELKRQKPQRRKVLEMPKMAQHTTIQIITP